MPQKIFLLPIAMLLLVACNSETSSKNLEDSRSNLEPSSSATNTRDFPEIQCQGEVPLVVTEILGEYKLAQGSDFVPTIRSYAEENPDKAITCSIFTADFNQDGFRDYTVLAVAPNQNQFRFMILLNQNNQSLEPAVIKDYKTLTNSSEGVIYTSMSLKAAGEQGALNRAYSPLKADNPESKIFESLPAIELWDAIKAYQVDTPQDLEFSTLAYCSENFYFVENKIKTFTVCD